MKRKSIVEIDRLIGGREYIPKIGDMFHGAEEGFRAAEFVEILLVLLQDGPVLVRRLGDDNPSLLTFERVGSDG